MLDINKIEIWNTVTFGKEVTKIVHRICRCDGGIKSVSFNDGTTLSGNDALWRLAELGRARLPEVLNSAFMRISGDYSYYFNTKEYTPETFLRRLKEDVAALEIAGVKANEN